MLAKIFSKSNIIQVVKKGNVKKKRGQTLFATSDIGCKIDTVIVSMPRDFLNDPYFLREAYSLDGEIMSTASGSASGIEGQAFGEAMSQGSRTPSLSLSQSVSGARRSPNSSLGRRTVSQQGSRKPITITEELFSSLSPHRPILVQKATFSRLVAARASNRNQEEERISDEARSNISFADNVVSLGQTLFSAFLALVASPLGAMTREVAVGIVNTPLGSALAFASVVRAYDLLNFQIAYYRAKKVALVGQKFTQGNYYVFATIEDENAFFALATSERPANLVFTQYDTYKIKLDFDIEGFPNPRQSERTLSDVLVCLEDTGSTVKQTILSYNAAQLQNFGFASHPMPCEFNCVRGLIETLINGDLKQTLPFEQRFKFKANYYQSVEFLPEENVGPEQTFVERATISMLRFTATILAQEPEPDDSKESKEKSAELPTTESSPVIPEKVVKPPINNFSLLACALICIRASELISIESPNQVELSACFADSADDLLKLLGELIWKPEVSNLEVSEIMVENFNLETDIFEIKNGTYSNTDLFGERPKTEALEIVKAKPIQQSPNVLASLDDECLVDLNSAKNSMDRYWSAENGIQSENSVEKLNRLRAKGTLLGDALLKTSARLSFQILINSAFKGG